MICFGQVAVLSASGAVNYTWNPGASTSSSISVSPTVTTVYTITGTNANGCISSATITQNAVDCTGLSTEASTKEDLSIYPNPFQAKITIISAKNVVAWIYNSIGSLILEQKLESERNEIDLSKEPNGIYFVKVGTQVKKIIKE